MLSIGASVVAILVGVTSFGSTAATLTSCTSDPPCGRPHLPASITIQAGSSNFRIAPDGQIRRIPPPHSDMPHDGTWFPLSGTWFVIRAGHLIVGRGNSGLRWRSRAADVAGHQLGVIMAGPRAIAFQRTHKLYLALPPGPERAVATREMPLGWTTGGLYTYRYKDHSIVLRSYTGRLLEVIAPQPLGSDYFVTGGRLFFIDRGEVLSSRGERTQRLASVRALGLSANCALIRAGGLIELQDDHHIVVLRPDGAVFARTHLPLIPGDAGVSSPLVTAAGERAVAFTAVFNRRTRPGVETVYLLRAGARRATALHREPVDFFPCGGGAEVQWHGNWLLYSASGDGLAAIDTVGRHRSIELSSVARGLAGDLNDVSAWWTGQAPAFG